MSWQQATLTYSDLNDQYNPDTDTLNIIKEYDDVLLDPFLRVIRVKFNFNNGAKLSIFTATVGKIVDTSQCIDVGPYDPSTCPP